MMDRNDNTIIPNIWQITSGLEERIKRLESLSNNARRTEVIFGDSSNNVDFTNLQDAIDLLHSRQGGVVFLKNGEYVIDSNINLYSGITLIGESPGGVTLNFDGGAYGIQIIGDDMYETGTVTVTHSSNAITGAGTSWTSGMVGQSIIIGSYEMIIEEVVDATHILTDSIYGSATESGMPYIITSPVGGVTLSRLFFINSTASNGAIYAKGFSGITIQDEVYWDNCTIGMKFEKGLGFWCTQWETVNCNYGLVIDTVGSTTFWDFGTINCGVGLKYDRLRNASISNFYLDNNTNIGMQLNYCRDTTCYDFAINNAISHGILVENTKGLSILGGNLGWNGGDGIRITTDSDYNSFLGISTTTNSGYGLNIANANCDRNIITNTINVGNLSGGVNNAGTNSIVTNNQVA